MTDLATEAHFCCLQELPGCGVWAAQERLLFPVVVAALEEYLSSYSEEASAHGYN